MTFTHYRHDPADERSLSGAGNVVHQDRDGTLWVGTAGGLDRMDPRPAASSTIATILATTRP